MQKPEKDGVASIYLACRSLMAGVVRRIVRRHDVEDILQEAFIRSFEAESRQTIHDARAFLLRTARNLALDHVSRAAYRRTGSLDGLDEEHSIDSAAPPMCRWMPNGVSFPSARPWAACRTNAAACSCCTRST